MDLTDPLFLETMRVRRCEGCTEAVAAELFGSDGSPLSADKAVVRAKNACERQRRRRARGTLWLIVGSAGVGKKSVFVGLEDEIRAKGVGDRVKFFRLQEVRPRASVSIQRRLSLKVADASISHESFARAQALLDYTTIVDCGRGEFVVPLSLTTYLADAQDERHSAVLLGTPAAYSALRAALPKVSVGVIQIACSRSTAQQRQAERHSGTRASLSAHANEGDVSALSSPGHTGQAEELAEAESGSSFGESVESAWCSQQDPFEAEMEDVPPEVLEVIWNDNSLGHALVSALEVLLT
eukprot:Rhum_TRINITY_DN17394_c0_g1::Rhum_TRINITY_DN17394_c0_g1_i1::g.165891::m.165891